MIDDNKTRLRSTPNRMSDVEIVVILILFYFDIFCCFMHYYKEYVYRYL